MEPKSCKDTVIAYGGRWETRLELPIETEILIPDYLPAVFKIVKCLVTPVVLQNRVTGGRWQGDGYLRCTVYYQSDEAGGRLYRTEQKFPFEKSMELPEGAYAEGPARLCGETEYCNCRAVSEHRIDLRGAYIIGIEVGIIHEQEILTSLSECGIEQRTRALHGLYRAAAEDRTVNSETALPMPATGESILDIDGSFTAGEPLTAAGQVSVQGALQIQICSRPADGEELTVRQKEIAVRQTVDLPSAAEGDNTLVWGEVLSCTLAEGDTAGEARLSVTWKLHLELWRAAEHTAVADAYSTRYEAQTVQTICKLLVRAPDPAARSTVRLEDDLPDAECTVKGCFVSLGAMTAVNDETDPAHPLRLTGRGVAHVLCADARGEIVCYDKAFTWQPDGVWQGAAADACPCLHAQVVRVSSGKDGARLHVEMEIALDGALLLAHSVEALCSVELGEEFTADKDTPSLYICYAQQGERIFDIAKRYHARAGDLAAANGLDTSETPPQELTTDAACLLIPAAL